MEPITIALALAKATGLTDLIGRKLGGDKGAEIAGRVIDAAQIVTGSDDPKAALDAMRANPEMIHALKMRLIDVYEAELRIEIEDRANARAMQIAAFSQSDTFSKRFPYYFACGWSLFAMTYIVIITTAEIPEYAVRFADATLTFLLTTAIGGVFGFLYGSTKGSQSKNEALEALAKKSTG